MSVMLKSIGIGHIISGSVNPHRSELLHVFYLLLRAAASEVDSCILFFL